MFIENIFRYPIKSVGSEELKKTFLKKGSTVPWDRTWGICINKSQSDNHDWIPPKFFARCYNFKLFSAISNVFDEATGKMILKHPLLKDLEFNLFHDKDFNNLMIWLQNLSKENFPQPKNLLLSKKNGFTDTNYPSISLNFTSSLNDLSGFSGFEISKGRFRGNIWINGTNPWIESELIGKKIKVGKVVLEVIEPILRCRTTEFSEESGFKDVDTLKILYKLNSNLNFGLYCKVLKDGIISINDNVEFFK